MTNNYMPAIKQRFWPRAAGRDIWAVVDGARDRAIYGALLDSYLNYSCLYHGEIAPELELAAPYLVQLEYDDSYSMKLIERAWATVGASFSSAIRAWTHCAAICEPYSRCAIKKAACCCSGITTPACSVSIFQPVGKTN